MRARGIVWIAIVGLGATLARAQDADEEPIEDSTDDPFGDPLGEPIDGPDAVTVDLTTGNVVVGDADPNVHEQFVGSSPPLVDESLPVVVGLMRSLNVTDATQMPVSLVGLDPDTLAERWRVPGLGDAMVDPVHIYTHLRTADGLILVTQANRVVRGIDPKDGAVRWTVQLSDVPGGLCLHEGKAWVRVVDGSHQKITPRTGAAEAVASLPEACGDLPDQVPEMPEMELDPAFPDLDAQKLEGMGSGIAVDRVRLAPSGNGVALLHKSPGTPVPHIGAVKGERLIWHRALFPADPFAPMAEALSDVILQGETLAVVPYRLRLGQNRLQAFDRSTGAVLWDVAIPHPEHQIEHVGSRGERIYVAHWTYLEAIDVKTGKPTGSYGVW